MNILNKEKILELARVFIEEGKFDKAIREYEKLLLADPTDTRIKLRVAELYTKRKQINDAIRIYREVANTYTADGFFLKAVTVFKNILRLNPAMIEVNEELAGLYEKMGLISDAVRQYEILASTLDMKGMQNRVVDIRRKIVGLNPSDGTARIRLAELCQREGNIDEAINQYEEYAKQLEESGADKSKLSDIYEKILAHRPAKFEMMRKLIYIYESAGDHKKALKWLEQGAEIVERDAELLSLQASIYEFQNQHDSARNKFMQLAEISKEEGNIDAALDAYFHILVMLPDEEERLAERIEELKPGAMTDLVQRALIRRQELEAEERKRQEAEDRGEKKPEDEKWSKKGKTKRKIHKPEPVAEPENIKNKPKEEYLPVAEQTPVSKPVINVAGMQKRADAAYDLGCAYKKMGLADESHIEMQKALAAYNVCIEAGLTSQPVLERVSIIEADLAEEKSTKTVSKETAPKVKTPAAHSQTQPKKPEKTKKNTESEKQKKRRVSFV